MTIIMHASQISWTDLRDVIFRLLHAECHVPMVKVESKILQFILDWCWGVLYLWETIECLAKMDIHEKHFKMVN